MLDFAREIRMLATVAIICCAPCLANADPPEREPTIGAGLANLPASQVAAVASSKLEPAALPSIVGLTPRERLGDERAIPSLNIGKKGLWRAELSAKWAELQSRILFEQEIIAACHLDDANCPAAA